MPMTFPPYIPHLAQIPPTPMGGPLAEYSSSTPLLNLPVMGTSGAQTQSVLRPPTAGQETLLVGRAVYLKGMYNRPTPSTVTITPLNSPKSKKSKSYTNNRVISPRVGVGAEETPTDLRITVKQEVKGPRVRPLNTTDDPITIVD
jgi:hypothetical protein